MTTVTCNLAVLGDHLGGFAAAALAVRRGKRVLLFETPEAEERRPLEYLNALTGGPEQEPGLARFFHEIGRSPFGPLGDDRIHFRALSPPLQVILAKHRLNIHAERTARAWEFQREFGDVHRALAGLWPQEEEFRDKAARLLPQPGDAASRSLPARALARVSGLLRLQALEREAKRRSFPEFIRDQYLPPELATALAAQAHGVTRRPAALTWAEGVRALRVGQGGLFQNASGQSGILRGLREIYLAAGGDVRPLVAVEGIDLPKSGGVRLHLAAGAVIRAERVIFDLPLAAALRLLPAEFAKTVKKKRIEEREEFAYGLLEFGIRPECRPEGMGKYLVIAPPAEAPAWSGVLLAAQPGEIAETGDRYGMEALAFFPRHAAGEGRTHLRERIRVVMPFLEETLVGDVEYRTGIAARYPPARLGLRQREERIGTGWRTELFLHRQCAFLRNEDYAAVGLAEGLLSGALAV